MLAGDEPELSQSAVAWAILNRGQEASRQAPPFGDAGHGRIDLGALCRSLLSELGSDAADAVSTDFADGGFCRAFATVCRVWAGETEDPTHGATHFHAHDAFPEWARERQPRALIGRRFFY